MQFRNQVSIAKCSSISNLLSVSCGNIHTEMTSRTLKLLHLSLSFSLWRHAFIDIYRVSLSMCSRTCEEVERSKLNKEILFHVTIFVIIIEILIIESSSQLLSRSILRLTEALSEKTFDTNVSYFFTYNSNL